LAARETLVNEPRSAVRTKKGRLKRWVSKALADPACGLEFMDETWFVWVPPAGILNPQTRNGWAARQRPPRNASSRKKGQTTTSAYLFLDVKEQRVWVDYAAHTNSTETLTRLWQRVAHHQRRGHTRLVVIWDQASWHVSKKVRQAIREHNRAVNQARAGVKIVPVVLPVHAFWLNPVEAIIGFAKRTALPCRQFETLEQQLAAIDRVLLHRNLRKASAPKVEDLLTDLH
jgi:hypothetical protein